MDTARILGRLEEHKDHADYRFNKLEEKVDKLLNSYWKLVGVTVGVATCVSILSFFIEVAVMAHFK